MSRYHLHGAELHRQTRSRIVVAAGRVIRGKLVHINGSVANLEAALERFAKRPGLGSPTPTPSHEPGAGGTFDGGSR